MFIKPVMLEPATVSLAVYMLTKTSKITKNKNLFLKKPYYLKKKICNWINNNKHDLTDIIIDESNEYLFDIINNIYTIKFSNPSIFILIYICILIITIII